MRRVGIAFVVALTATACAGDTRTASTSATSATGARNARPGATGSTTAPLGTRAPRLPAGDDTVVTRQTDGDTLWVAPRTKVRLIGINTPEISGTAQCFGREAAAALAQLTPLGTKVRLVYDVGRTDRYGRTLAYLYRRRDGLFVNLELAERGYAVPMTVPPDVARAGEFVAAARRARVAGRGLWRACGGDPTGSGSAGAPPSTGAPPTPPTSAAPTTGAPPAPPTSAAPTTSAPPSPTTRARSSCDPAYPDVCIPPAPPDLDCGDISARRFRVVPPDPHGFDGDGDGIGCES
ncbi:MAG: thermonuclease family protein [Actinobacteria bacterium]|nr:thermonuclease family protein [Actinomycetota bacterium]